MTDMAALHAEDGFSQHGEDGIIVDALEKIGALSAEKQRWCVEFGGGNGIYCSNTLNLVKNYGYRSVMIEPDDALFAELEANLAGLDTLNIHRAVGFDAECGLDAILAETDIPNEFDFLSIDIDGNDYHALAAVNIYSPKMICVEFNPTMPVEIDYVQPCDLDVIHGNSLAALDRLLREKGYRSFATTTNNLFAIRRDLAHLLTDSLPSLETLGSNIQKVVIFVTYDGTLLSNAKGIGLNWHGLFVPLDDFQILPRQLRKSRAAYGLFESLRFLAIKYRLWLKRGFRHLLAQQSSGNQNPNR
tara:strand:- start:95 stop:1000 length:906 start_codon:yes stop_codon:yes gene_type:complete